MIDFEYKRATNVRQALELGIQPEAVEARPAVRFIAGGTTLIDLMKLDVEAPHRVIDINRLELSQVVPRADGSLYVGALVRNSDLAHHPLVQQLFPVLSQALLSGASPQLRNMATTGGNLLQRSRCAYFRDTVFHACNKREPGSGCAALEGHNRTHAILGTSMECIATHPSDMAVAMMALEAEIQIEGKQGKRSVAIRDFYCLPGMTPHVENVLLPGELIAGIVLPRPRSAMRSAYLKLRDRASYEFALASAAVVVEQEQGRVRFVRIALGGVGTRPWRALEAEALLADKACTPANFLAAAEAALASARPRRDRRFKVELAKRCLVRVLTVVTSEIG